MPALYRSADVVLATPWYEPFGITPVEAAGWAGDVIEAQTFGYLAIRSVKGLPLSLPGTTGVPEPLTGGRLNLPA